MLIILFIVAYIWVLRNAQYLLQEFVRSESNGKVELTSKQVRYSFRKHQFVLINPTLRSMGEDDKATSYVISLQKITLNTGSLQSIIFRQKILIDSIDCVAPHVEVIKSRRSTNSKISLPEEFAKIYKSIEETITKLQIKHLAIHSGSFSLIKKYDPESSPIRISNIDLAIRNFGETSKQKDNERVFFTDEIVLQSSNQDIVFPDGFHGLRFSKFKLNTRTNIIEIDSCYIYGNRTNSYKGEFGIFFDTLRLLNPDLNALSKRNLIKVDSAVCINPNINFSFDVKNTGNERGLFPTKKREKDSLQASFKKLFANLDLQYIGVQNADIDIRVKRGENFTSYTSKKSNFNLHQLLIVEDPDIPIQLERFDFAIRNYIGYSPDSIYAIKFDSILLVKNKVSLSNFSIAPTGNNSPEWKEVKTRAFQLEDITWEDLIYNNRIVAERAILVQPEVEIRNPRNPDRVKKKKGSLYLALAGFKRNLEINYLVLSDAKIAVASADGSILKLNGFNTVIRANSLLGSDDAGELINSIHKFSFSTGSLNSKGRNFDLLAGIYDGDSKSLILGKAVYTGPQKSAVINADNIIISDIERSGSFQFKASTVSWQKANIFIDHSGKSQNENKENASFIANWQQTRANQTNIKYVKDGMKLETFVSTFLTGPVSISDNNPPGIQNIKVDGRTLLFRNEGLSAFIGKYAIHDKELSRLDNVELMFAGKKEDVVIKIPSMVLEPDIEDLMNGQKKAGKIVLNQPYVDFLPGTKKVTSGKQSLPVFSIERLELNGPVINKKWELMNTGLQPETEAISFVIENLVSANDEINVGRFTSQLKTLGIKSDQVSLTTSPDSIKSFDISAIQIIPARENKKLKWAALVNDIRIPAFDLTIKPEDMPEKHIEAVNFQLRNIQVGTDYPLAISTIFGRNKNLKLNSSYFSWNNSRSTIKSTGIVIDNSSGTAGADSISFKPNPTVDSFISMQEFRKDYITVNIGKVRMRNLAVDKFLSDSILNISSLDIEHPSMHIYKDMHLPFKEGIIKPLPTVMIRKLPTKIAVDSIRLYDAVFTYEEFNDKTNKNGVAQFNHTNALITNFRNAGIKEGDSLDLQLTTMLLDTALIKMRFTESYTDTLHGFVMGVRMGKFGLPILNPILEPIASARIDAGFLDTLNMRAVGREYVAWGKMQMYYRGLHVNYLNKKDVQKKTVLTRLINFVANAVLHKKNIRKTGTVYVERLREKSFFNYWLKIVLSGAMTNAGIKGITKSERRNHREVKKLYVPEIEIMDRVNK